MDIIDLFVIGQARCAIKIIWNSFIKTVYISSGMDYKKVPIETVVPLTLHSNRKTFLLSSD